MIEDYLRVLDAELRVPRCRRARILAEVRDHLDESVAAGVDEARAVEGFGAPAELAARFHAQLAATSAHRAARRSVLLVGLALVAAAVASPASVNSPSFGLVVAVCCQLAFVAVALALARSVRYRVAGAVPAARLADLYRASGLAVASIGVAAVAGLVGAWKTHGFPSPLAVGAGIVVAASVAAAWSVAGSVARARAVPAAGQPAEDALDDLLAVAWLGWEFAERRVRRLRRLRAAISPAPPFARWLDLRRHPWRFAVLFALACGVALAVGHGIADGGLSVRAEGLPRALRGALTLAGVEAAAVMACFAAFGRFLGIRRAR